MKWNIRMKKIASVFLIMILQLVSTSFCEELHPADLSEGSRLVGLMIARENLPAYTVESGFLPAFPPAVRPVRCP